MFGFKKKKDIPVPPTPEEVSKNYENKTVSVPSGDPPHEEITEPIQKPTPIPKPLPPKPVVKPAPVQKPAPKPVRQITPRPIIHTPQPMVKKPEPRPFFVLKRGYHIVLDSIKEIDTRIDNVQPTTDFLIKNKNKQDVKFEEIRITLEDIERKLLYVDKTMFER